MFLSSTDKNHTDFWKPIDHNRSAWSTFTFFVNFYILCSLKSSEQRENKYFKFRKFCLNLNSFLLNHVPEFKITTKDLALELNKDSTEKAYDKKRADDRITVTFMMNTKKHSKACFLLEKEEDRGPIPTIVIKRFFGKVQGFQENKLKMVPESD